MHEISAKIAEALAGLYDPIGEIGRHGKVAVYLAGDLRHNWRVAG